MFIAQDSADPCFADGEVVVPNLTQLQWTVVHIAIREVGDLTHFARLSLILIRAASAFGIQQKWQKNDPLANPELEALRQYVCLSRQFDNSACEIVPVLLASGFDQENLSALTSLIRTNSRKNDS